MSEGTIIAKSQDDIYSEAAKLTGKSVDELQGMAEGIWETMLFHALVDRPQAVWTLTSIEELDVPPDQPQARLNVEVNIPRPPSSGFELFAKIKKSSKYYGQGLNESRKPIFFQIRSFNPAESDGYCVRMGGNRYRLEDLQFYVRVGKEMMKL